MPIPQKDAETKPIRNLLDFIILQLLREQPMHGYQMITRIRRSFGIYVGPSIIYPLLTTLEKKEFINSSWNTKGSRPKKVYILAKEGLRILDFAKESLSIACKQISATSSVPVNTADDFTEFNHE
jgi:PadR family transcriptional regulator PadR